MPSVSHSEVEGYLLCRRKHYYGYTLSLRRVRESMSLSMGSLGHGMLEAFYAHILANTALDDQANKDVWSNAVGKALTFYQQEVKDGFEQPDNRANIHDLFITYIEHEPLIKSGWQILAVEKRFSLEYDPNNQLRYPFVVDLIARDPHGKIVVVDHKFVYDFYSYEDTQLQPQIPKYIGALRALGFKVDYGVYNMLRTRKVSGPKMLKAELVEVVSAAITKAGGDPKSDYDKPVEKLTVGELQEIAIAFDIEPVQPPSPDQQLGWMEVKPNNTRVKRVFIEQIRTAEEIQKIKDLTPEEQDITAVRVANKMICNSCSFRDICRTELVGGNVKIVIDTEYVVRERKEFDVTDDGLDDEDAA